MSITLNKATVTVENDCCDSECDGTHAKVEIKGANIGLPCCTQCGICSELSANASDELDEYLEEISQ